MTAKVPTQPSTPATPLFSGGVTPPTEHSTDGQINDANGDGR